MKALADLQDLHVDGRYSNKLPKSSISKGTLLTVKQSPLMSLVELCIIKSKKDPSTYLGLVVKIWSKAMDFLQTFFLDKYFSIAHIRENICLGAKFEENPKLRYIV